MEIKYSNKPPQLTGTYNICPIPFKYDTYVGCSFGCQYCFARDIVQFARKTHKSENKTENENCFSYLKSSDPKKLRTWIKNTEKETTNLEKLMFRNRIPIKIGVMADPFPYIESELKITYETLKVFDEVDYPIQISTKNPKVLLEYAKDFIKEDGTLPNWALSVTLITNDDEIRKAIEPNAPSILDRINAIKELNKLGFNVIVRIQPIIYPYILSIYKDFIKQLNDIGVKTVIVECLKIRKAMTIEEKLHFDIISKSLGYDIVQWYKDNGQLFATDYCLNIEDKLNYISLIREECNKYGMTLNVGDNDCRNCSADKECCGTSSLRNHKRLIDCEELLDYIPSNVRGNSKAITIREKINQTNVLTK